MVSINTNLSSMLVAFLPLSLRRGQGEVLSRKGGRSLWSP